MIVSTSLMTVYYQEQDVPIRQIKVKALWLNAGRQRYNSKLTGPCQHPGERPGTHCTGDWDKLCI
jgi:hypothetical protein